MHFAHDGFDAPGSKAPRGKLIIISGATCVGKGELKRKLMEEYPQISRWVTCTTREPRKDEVAGVNYHYFSLDEFKKREKNREFYETKLIHGNWYGVPCEGMLDRLRNGEIIVVDIDVEGADDIRNNDELKEFIVDIFVLYPDIDVIKERMLKRDGKLDQQRLDRAPLEQQRHREFCHRIVNDDLERAFADLCRIVSPHLN